MKALKGIAVFLFDLFLLFLCALIASLAFPSKYSENGFPFLSFFYLIPVFWIIWKSKWRAVWFYGLWYGFIFYLFYNYWLETFHPLAILIAPILESIQYLLLFLVLRGMKTLFKKHYSIAGTLIYCAYLYLTQQGFLAYPYGNISTAVYSFTSLIQIVSITGIWGLNLIMVLPQAIIAEAIKEKRIKEYRYTLSFSLLLLSSVWLWGTVEKTRWENKESEREIRIAAIQHSADTWKGGYSTYRANFETLKRLTEEAMKEDPDLVVWSETAFVPSVRWHAAYPNNVATSRLCNDFVSFGSNLGVPLVTGNPEGVIKDKDLAPILEDGEWNWKTYNTVIMFSDGGIKNTYRKQHLVPFTENFPYEKEFPWLYELLLANDYKWWEEGDEAVVFEYDGMRFSTPICFEDTFGYLSAQFVQGGADILMNLSNDYWSESVQAELQHYQIAVFRAVENRRPLLRSTNSGITCLVLPTGESEGILPTFEEAWRIYDVPLYADNPLTFYTRHPDLFGKLYVILSLIMVFGAIIYKATFYFASRRRGRSLWRKMEELLIKDRKSFISVTGGGGKTSFLIEFSSYLKKRGYSVLITTSTKLASPESVDYKCDKIFMSDAVMKYWPGRGESVFYANYDEALSKCTAPKEGVVALLSERYDVVIVEADGSRGLPLKVHSSRDPVIWRGSRAVVSISGMWVYGKAKKKAVFGEKKEGKVNRRYLEEYIVSENGASKGMDDNSLSVYLFNGAEESGIMAYRAFSSLTLPSGREGFLVSIKKGEIYAAL